MSNVDEVVAEYVDPTLDKLCRCRHDKETHTYRPLPWLPREVGACCFGDGPSDCACRQFTLTG